jgi:hypothetical protein
VRRFFFSYSIGDNFVNQITINGNSIQVSGNNVSIVNGVIKVNGVVVASDLTGEVNIKWEGDHPANLNSDASVSCKIHGNWYVESLEF